MSRNKSNPNIRWLVIRQDEKRELQFSFYAEEDNARRHADLSGGMLYRRMTVPKHVTETVKPL